MGLSRVTRTLAAAMGVAVGAALIPVVTAPAAVAASPASASARTANSPSTAHILKKSRHAAQVQITKVSASSVNVGDKFTISGSASKNLNGKKVRLQIRDETSWSTIASARVSAKGKFTITTSVTTAGRGQKVRVRAPQTSTTYAATSKAKKVNVYGWYKLGTDIKIIEGTGFSWGVGNFDINGRAYPNAVYRHFRFTSDPIASFNLSRKCTVFQATIGVPDVANANASMGATIRADNLEVWQNNSIVLGSSYPVKTSVAGALRLTFEPVRLKSNGIDEYLIFGDAKVLCAF